MQYTFKREFHSDRKVKGVDERSFSALVTKLASVFSQPDLIQALPVNREFDLYNSQPGRWQTI